MTRTLGPIPDELRTTIERWIADARATDPDKLHDGDSLFIGGGPAWCNSISPDGTIWLHDYSDTPATTLTDAPSRIKTVVIAGKHRPELLVWLPKRAETDSNCAQCSGTGWRRIGDNEFICETCNGLGWLAATEIA